MDTIRRPILLAVAMLLGLLLPACTAPPPSAGDVAAERGWYVTVRDAVADGVVDEAERPAVFDDLAAWDAKLVHDEQAVARSDTTAQDLIRVYGLAAVQIWLEPELKARAPDLFRLADRDESGSLSEAEILAIDPKSPAFAAVVLSTAARLLSKHRSP